MRAHRQVIATERFSLPEFCAYSGFAGTARNAGGARRDVVDAVSTVAWVRQLQQRSKWASPYAVGMAVEPEAYWKGARERFHRNKWSKYERGLHRPHPSLVERAEQRFPGSAKELNSVIWDILKRPPSSPRGVAELEQRLDPEVRLAITRWLPRIQASKNGSIQRLASVLESLATLDGLAAMLLQCHAARLTGDTETACRWVWHIYRGLVMLGGFLRTRGIAQPLFELIEERMFKDVAHQGGRYYFPAALYIETIGDLSNILWHIEGVPYTSMSERERRSYMQRILDGDFGWDLKFAFNPVRRPLPGVTDIEEDDARNSLRGMHLFLWAWNMRRSFEAHPQFPPAEVLDGTDLWARRPDRRRHGQDQQPGQP